MSEYANQSTENKSASVGQSDFQQRKTDAGIQLADNRPEVITQRKLQDIANNSARVQQLKTYQQVADNYIQRKENNTGLPDNLKAGVENLSGFSMDDVKVHYNSSQPEQMQAHAYAQGSNIHIAPGQEQHLPHEAWHVVQQKQGRVQPTLQMKGIAINNDSALEQEADVMGAVSLKQTTENQSVMQKFATAVQPIIQRIQITVDGKKVTVTKGMTAGKIIEALGYIPSGNRNYSGAFSSDISSEDAASIIEELKDHDQAKEELKGLLNDLDDIAEESDNDEEDGSGSLEDGSVSDDDDFFNIGASSIKAIDRQAMPERQKKIESLKKKGFDEGDAETIVTGLRVQQLFTDWGGKTIYLSGGGAIALYAQHRSIEDLDFRISADELDGKISWYKEEDDDEGGTEWIPDDHLDELNTKLEKGEQFTNVPKGKKPNATNTRTAGVENFEGTHIEVSITIVGTARDTEIDKKTNIRRLSKPNLLADKLKTAISRNKIGEKYVKKVSKDIYDSLVVYADLYGGDDLSADIIKGHLSERANEYRESNTEQNRDAISKMAIELLVEQMFNRLVKTADSAAVRDGVNELADDGIDITNELFSLVSENIEPEIDVTEAQWFKVGKKGKKTPITNQAIQEEITADFAKYLQDLELEITTRIDGL